jgi:hypothetical protein
MRESRLFGSEGGAKLSFVPTPIRPPPIVVATSARPLLGDPLELEGVRSVGAGEKVLTHGARRQRGTAALVRLRVRTNSGVKVPVGQSTGCP